MSKPYNAFYNTDLAVHNVEATLSARTQVLMPFVMMIDLVASFFLFVFIYLNYWVVIHPVGLEPTISPCHLS